MARKTNANPQEPDRMEIADRIHSAAIHVLRAIRRSDVESGMSAARLSLLSVLVFRGSTSMGELAEAEQVSLPTISRMVASLEHAGFVVREKSA
jgi:DNA-binding MarR family transcriptional regulator